VLKRLKAQPRCERRIVRADFSLPWTDAILSAGFDPSRSAAILAEGFLPYLDESVVARLFETIGSLAREGSWLGLDIRRQGVMSGTAVGARTRPGLRRLPYTANRVILGQCIESSPSH
jgi:O-methyltransferase involved in polyketide biosynthesis